MDDIAPGLLEKLRKTFSENLESDKKAGSLRKKIEQGTANYETAGDYAGRVGKALSEAFNSCLSDDVLPDGKMYWNIAERVLQPVFKDDYEILSDAAVKVQQSLNSKAKIGLKAQKAEMDEGMVSGVMNKIASTEKYSESAYVLKEASDTFSRSVVDNTLKANIEFQGKAGRKPRIIRTPASGCCEWCAGLAGTYSYPDTPKDVYARHNNCNCIVEYDPGSGSSRQNVHTKQWTSGEESAKIEARKTIGLETKLNKEALKSVNLRTGGMTTEEYAEYKRKLAAVSDLKQIYLPKEEYAHVMSELNTNMSDEDRKHAIVSMPIGNYAYTVINNGFDNYKVVKRTEIESSIADFIDGK